MSILGVIPARYASTRFPGKALTDVNGKSMIRCVYEQAIKSERLDHLIVATDDQRIMDEVAGFDGKAVMTSHLHTNGTERCAEVSTLYPDFEYIINIQGDEPFIHPQQVDTLADLLDGNVEIGTLIKTIENPEALDDPGEMKVVFNKNHEAVYFSRACIPYLRDIAPEARLSHHTYYKHIGIYAYRRDVLSKIVKLPHGKLEQAESLEQLRWIEHGYTINLGFTDIESHMIDTPEDLRRLLSMINA